MGRTKGIQIWVTESGTNAPLSPLGMYSKVKEMRWSSDKWLVSLASRLPVPDSNLGLGPPQSVV